jgi:hypothetical protein
METASFPEHWQSSQPYHDVITHQWKQDQLQPAVNT